MEKTYNHSIYLYSLLGMDIYLYTSDTHSLTYLTRIN